MSEIRKKVFGKEGRERERNESEKERERESAHK